MGVPHGHAPDTRLVPALKEIQRELMEARDLTSLGRRHRAFPDVLHGARRQYWRHDYIDHCRRARSNDNRIDAPSGYGRSNADHHYNRRHVHDLVGNPHMNRYKQHHEGGPRGWLHRDAQLGCPCGAHLLDGSCFM
ncbi:hypothetical protein D1007_20348 [Hordeum vulgare]|nr:hypothetical protein D1007_20348 [Hordeum vulgare]